MTTRGDQERIKADEARVAQAGARWRAHSRRIMLYRRVLPVLILVLAGGSLSWVALRTVISGVERKASQGQEIQLDKPLFHGQDGQGRAFTVGAVGAVRDPETGNFRLVGPNIKLNLGGRKITEMTAEGGTYNPAGRKVIIGPNVRINDGGTGFVLTTPEAIVDTQTGIVTGSKGVHGSGAIGTVNASSYAIYDQGQRVVFNGQGDTKITGTIIPSGSNE